MKNLVIAVILIALVFAGSFMLLNKPPGDKEPADTSPAPATTAPTETTNGKTPAGDGSVCMDPDNNYSIQNRNACKNANDLGTCKLDLDGNNIPDVDDICGLGFRECCCAHGYEKCC
ncbi:MAG: hypothetical protein JW724_06650 [Candidatus Altiarchaeota archaeon]|nr:hypothetical protein [Candidatus Altiarchaeota archaeon]